MVLQRKEIQLYEHGNLFHMQLDMCTDMFMGTFLEAYSIVKYMSDIYVKYFMITVEMPGELY